MSPRCPMCDARSLGGLCTKCAPPRIDRASVWRPSCRLCLKEFDGRETDYFCPACVERCKHDDRGARIARGDLNVMYDANTTDAERDTIIRARRDMNITGI